ncbi:MAG: flagellar basal body L-ring protein FlgH [Acidithiobacillus sp.]|nr:flagellar basal body L-ring protein FlgH [Acidithiobacillus sp.]
MSDSWKMFQVLAVVIMLSGCAPGMPFHKKKPFTPLPLPPMTSQTKPGISGQVYQPTMAENWFSDHQAWQVGDVITVDIIENATASNAISNATSRKSSIGDAISSFFGIPLSFGNVDGAKISPNVSAQSAISSSGSGASTQSNTLVSTISATVTKVLPNGNLEIVGQTELNSGAGTGAEWIRVSGIVRAEDISNDTVPSTDVADARVEYSGSGQGYEAARMPWLARFFLSLWPF